MNQTHDTSSLWLTPEILDYAAPNNPTNWHTIQDQPRRWHTALVAIINLRPPKNTYGLRRQSWQDALQTVHDIIAREMLITR